MTAVRCDVIRRHRGDRLPRRLSPFEQITSRSLWPGHRRSTRIASRTPSRSGRTSLTDAAKGPTPIPNAAEANPATPSAFFQNKELGNELSSAVFPEVKSL
jgi:hypothetical protein